MKWNRLALVLVAFFALATASCAKKAIEGEASLDEPAAAEPQSQPVAEPEPQIDTEAIQAAQQHRDQADARNRFLNDHIYFDFDSAVLRPDAIALLRLKAQWLEDNAPVISLLIEGHCDERGTDAYNLALGEKRADAVQQYLLNLGFDPRRFQIVSYGEERPLDAGHSEEAWAKNRRASFAID